MRTHDKDVEGQIAPGVSNATVIDLITKSAKAVTIAQSFKPAWEAQVPQRPRITARSDHYLLSELYYRLLMVTDSVPCRSSANQRDSTSRRGAVYVSAAWYKSDISKVVTLTRSTSSVIFGHNHLPATKKISVGKLSIAATKRDLA